MAVEIEHEIQRQMLERLGIEWTPGEPFYALVEDKIVRLRDEVADYEDRVRLDAGLMEADRAENERLRAALSHIADLPECFSCKVSAFMDPRRVAARALGYPKAG